jgi:hypothetical protein
VKIWEIISLFLCLSRLQKLALSEDLGNVFFVPLSV